jgi:putative FmdB family regulatory protein
VPIFEYKCDKCGKTFEMISMFHSLVKCPDCDNGEVKRILSPTYFKINGYSYSNGYSKGDK